MQDIMVDVETTGTSPDRHAVIQIASVKFDLATFDVEPSFFNRCLQIPKWRSWDEETRTWWSQQKQEVLREIFSRMEPPGAVMSDFLDWIGPGQWRMWAKPITFDYPFISSYFRDFDVYNPFDFRTAMDCRSYLRGIAHPVEFVSEKSIEFKGDAHNAIYDTLHQVRWLFVNQEQFGGPRVEIEAA